MSFAWDFVNILCERIHRCLILSFIFSLYLPLFPLEPNRMLWSSNNNGVFREIRSNHFDGFKLTFKRFPAHKMICAKWENEMNHSHHKNISYSVQMTEQKQNYQFIRWVIPQFFSIFIHIISFVKPFKRWSYFVNRERETERARWNKKEDKQQGWIC